MGVHRSTTSASVPQADRGRQAFAAKFPAVANRIAAQAMTVTPVLQDNQAVDIDHQGARFYKGDARQFAERQVRDYLAQPNRLVVNTPSTVGLGNPVSKFMMHRVGRELESLGIEKLDRFPRHDSMFLIVLGLGLGYHLEPLMAATKAANVIIVEPMADFLNASFGALDWAALIGRAERDGINLHVICDETPTRIVDAIIAIIAGVGVPFLDGAYVFLHYPSWTLREARTQLGEATDRAFLSKGFFEDELVMLTNCHANISRHRHGLLDGRRRALRGEPAFVVGSGPSIDETLPVVKRWRDRCILFSCGTSLRILLRHGLVPDFHCELENGIEVFESLSKVAAEHSLAGITLIASNTIDPRIAPLFDARLFYFRDTVSSTQLLQGGAKEIYLTGPTVTNTAVATGAMLGFGTFYLFGVDCGVKEGGQHHSKDTLYYSDDNWRELAEKTFDFPLTAAGNFGGVVHTNYFLELTRNIMSGIQMSNGIRLFNCSDGARIDRALPKLAAHVALDNPPIERAKVVGEICAQSRTYEPGEYVTTLDLAATVDNCRRFYQAADALMAAAQRDDRQFADFHRRLVAFFADARARFGRVDSMCSGSALAIPKIGAYAIHRMADAAQRAHMLAAFLDEYRKLMAEMGRVSLTLLRGFAGAAGPNDGAAD